MADLDLLDEDIKMSVVKFKEEKQRKIKGISKAIYILATIGKIDLTIAFPIMILLIIITPIFISKVELKGNKIVFNGEKIDDKITITEEKSDDNIILKLKVNDVVVADANLRLSYYHYSNIFNNCQQFLVNFAR